jgi:uncharacterized protein YyaL (SSP411 family)
MRLRVNRLAGELSPYLQQHAGNPVNWYPWGPEALERAKREDRPILLSIGYSACHWCHVMERESFENDAIARVMNEHFVNVKVDREERPDLDQVYQLVVQLMGRSGGWPLTVFLTPDQRPFFGGTYFPPVDRYGMPGFPTVLERVRDAYRTQRAEIDEQASEITRTIADVQSRAGAAAGAVTPEALGQAAKKLVARFDEEHGGFGVRPKFPNTMALEVLLRAGDVPRVRTALDAMRAGGIWDHLGGGFHRYSTDERWLVPHFEKMLYDNALLLRLYADAWRRAGEARDAETARSIAAYAAREMTAPGGGFYATQDADSDGDEGKFFVWTPLEIDAACSGDEEASRVAKVAFDVTDAGNFEHTGASVLATPAALDEVANTLGMPRAAALAALERARGRMFEAREKRVKPFRDEKILASWNGLMAGALATAGAAIGDPSMIAAAARALAFVEASLVVREGSAARVLRHVKDGVARGPGFLDDHAFVADAALDLYEATGEPRWAELARAIGSAIVARFYDEGERAFHFSPDDGEAILVRPRDPYDHAVPGAGSIASRVLLRLGTLVDPSLTRPAEASIEALAGAAAENPMGMSVTVALVDRLARGSVDVVVVGARTDPRVIALAREALRAPIADRVLAWLDPSDPESVAACAALAEGKPATNEPVAYVCRGRSCSLPIADPAELGHALRATS